MTTLQPRSPSALPTPTPSPSALPLVLDGAGDRRTIARAFRDEMLVDLARGLLADGDLADGALLAGYPRKGSAI